MTIEFEDEFIGKESHLVPIMDPDDDCNAKKTDDVESENDGTRTIFKGYCNNKAGKGTDHVGDGRCKFHGGCNTGAGAHNQNATKTALTADPHHYHENMDPERKQFIEETTHVILDRIRQGQGREPDPLDKMLARRVVIKLDIVAKASAYVENVSGLVQIIQTEGGSHEDKAALLDEIRRFDNSIFQNLRELGVDPKNLGYTSDPESKKAESMDDWREFIESGKSDEKAPENEQ